MIFFYPDVTVLRWVDGDTVDLRIRVVRDFGFHFKLEQTFEDRFRLYGIDTPERGQAGWAEATAEAKRLAPAGSAVTIHTYKDERDKYGRWLAEVTPVDAEATINRLLVDGGFAKPYFGGTKG